MKLTAMQLMFLTGVLMFVRTLEAAFKEDCLNVHNKLRALHVNTPAVVWDDALASSAQSYANKLAATGSFKHSGGGDYGENLYMSGGMTPSCTGAVLSWYNEYDFYNYNTASTNTPGKLVGHFTQVIWKATTKIGVGIATAGSNSYIVAQYKTKGNSVSIKYGESYDKAKLRVYNVEVQKKKTDSNGIEVKTPTLYEINPSLCVNGDNNCDLFIAHYTCNKQFVQRLCPKACNVC